MYINKYQTFIDLDIRDSISWKLISYADLDVLIQKFVEMSKISTVPLSSTIIVSS